MSTGRPEVSQYVDELLAVPRAHLRLELTQDEGGVTLRHDGRVLVQCPLSRGGMLAAGFMAQALGTKVPALGDTGLARVSTGVLYRAIAVAGFDFDKDESYVLLERLLEEAEQQRGGSSDAL